ncbi:MCE family protein [Magnetovirga frankeli]|uniref:PqiB family protein n=1 Tax=Magnetovirga frankeli TaxID=947516 RepID=UPI0012935D75|nr:MCE family protein [gamma proteobacterium SS-5]
MNDLHELAASPLQTKQRGPSLIWLVPLLALLIGAWIAWQDWSQRGPEIEILFQDVKGLEEGKSKIRYRSLEVGLITALELTDDLRQVRVRAQLKKGAERYLSSDSRFWVVRPRVALGQVSGLETLLSGSFIEMDAGNGQADDQRAFVGLEQPPAVSIHEPGQVFGLYADRRGSVSIGSGVFYRNIQVGLVKDLSLRPEKQRVEFEIFLRQPFDRLVTENTVFWNAGGFNLSLGAEGVELAIESLESLVSGGIAFGLPKGVEAGAPVADGALFELYASETLAARQRNRESTRYVLYFTDSVRGLAVGAPVEFSGIRLGEVLSIGAEYDSDSLEIRIPVTIEIERGRFRPTGGNPEQSADERLVLQALVERGLRASLKSGNLLTGSQFVDLVFMPESDQQAAPAGVEPPHPVIPTVSTGFNLLQQRITSLVARLDQLPIERIGANLDKSMLELNTSLVSLNAVLKPFGERSAPMAQALERTLERTSKVMASADKTLNPNSQLQTQLLKALEEFSAASKAIRDLSRFIERNPQALLLGK